MQVTRTRRVTAGLCVHAALRTVLHRFRMESPFDRSTIERLSLSTKIAFGSPAELLREVCGVGTPHPSTNAAARLTGVPPWVRLGTVPALGCVRCARRPQ